MDGQKPALRVDRERLPDERGHARSRKLASALSARGIGQGDTVSVMLANTPAMLEAHYGVPMTGAVLQRHKVVGYAAGLLTGTLSFTADALMLTTLSDDKRMVFIPVGP